MTSKTELWDRLGRTDPSHTKSFKRAGGFTGTAIKPIWSYRRMTEEFGPCGKGWGINAPHFQVVNGPDEVLVYCTASVWFEGKENVVYGVGGDKVAGKNKFGTVTDDEAFKKAYTDAVTNALKMIGVGADVHMGMFDDNKYVNTMRDEYADKPIEKPVEKPKSSAELKRENAWELATGELENDLLDCHSFTSLEKLKEEYRAKVTKDWPKSWTAALKNMFDAHEDKLIKQRERDEASNEFPGDTDIRNVAGRKLHSMEGA